MNTRLLYWHVLILLGLPVAACVGCQKHGTGAPQGGANVPPAKVNLKRRVEIGIAERRTLQDAVNTVGMLEAEGETAIPAGVSGVVDEIYFREGDAVSPDMVLMVIDQQRYLAAAEVARANELRTERALAIAKDAADRVRETRAGVSEEERTRLLLTFQVAEAERRVAQAQRQLAERNLDLSRVRPRYAGRINSRLITKGSYVEEKTTIATIADTRRLRLVGYVPESAADLVRNRLKEQRFNQAAEMFAFSWAQVSTGSAHPVIFAGQLLGADQSPSRYNVEFEVPAFPRLTFQGRLFHLSTVASRETHMFESKAEVLPHLSGELLQPGYSAKVRFPLRTNPDAIVIPEESVRPNEKGFIVFIPEQRRNRQGQTEWVARARELRLGLRPTGWVEVRSGLRPGDKIVQRGAAALEDGTPIQFEDTK